MWGTGSNDGVLYAVQSSWLPYKKQYGEDKTPLDAFKAIRQNTQVLQGPGSS